MIEPPYVALYSKNPNKYNFDFDAKVYSKGYYVDVPLIQSISINWN